MSGRFVRASKFRHVHGDASRKDKCYLNVRPLTSGEGDFIAVNGKYLAYAMPGGGGPVVVHPVDKIGRLDHTPPVFNVHKQKVLDFKFSPFIPNLIATGGDDGHGKITLIPENLEGSYNDAAASLEGHQKKIHIVDFHPCANNVLLTASFDHTIKVWDIQAQQARNDFSDHPDVVQSTSWNANGSLLATTCKDRYIRIFDPRTPAQVQQAEGFEGAKPSRAIWISNRNYLMAVGFQGNRSYILWDHRNLVKPLVKNDIDQAAGTFISYYDPDTSILYLGGKGDGNIRYFEITDEPPYVHFLSEYRSSEPQKGLAFMPKRHLNVMACEIARGYRLMKDYIEPVSFQVPRKSDIFQDDLYPDTYAGVPSVEAPQWFEGKDADPVTKSMKPGTDDGESAVTTFVAQKSPSDLQAELDIANKRIKELEEQLKALQG